MSRALRFVLAICLALPMLFLSPTDRANAQSDQASYVDVELQLALREADLIDEWIVASGISGEAALVEVIGDASYQAVRTTLLGDLDQLIERREHIDDQRQQAATLTADLDRLQALTRELRREVSGLGSTAAVSLTPRTVARANLTLEGIAVERRWLGISLDMFALAEDRLVQARDAVARQVHGLSQEHGLGQEQGTSSKTLESTISSFTDVTHDLRRVRSLIENAVQRSLAAEFEYAAERSTIEATMPTLHEMRLVSSTSVGGLTVVTLDAYVRGAHALDPACPVDWALLAGIGRVESRHGTIDDSIVQRSGRVSRPIFGPLLDGGATAREADAAADAAEAARDAEEALRQAEALAEQAAEAAAQAALEALVWGEEAAAQARELEEQAEAEEARTPRFDPLLWGDDLPFDEDDPGVVEDDTSDEQEDEPQFRGNGFAVIADSDNGRLDGNARWDRAVGPMQFIPETWSYWETDGNDDGVIDPQNLYDAAATAGQFLCHLSRTRGASPSSFVLGYNSSQTYVRNVLAVADAFATSELPTVDD